MRRLLLACALILLAPSAHAATATSTAAGTFAMPGGVASGTMTWSGGDGVGGAPDQNDDIVFAHDPTIIGDVDQITGGAWGITCNAGVTVTIDAATVGGKVQIILGDDGWDCDQAGNVHLINPGYVQPPTLGRAATPALLSDEPSTGDAFTISEVCQACGDAGTAEEPDANGDLATPGDKYEVDLRWPAITDNENGNPDDRGTVDAVNDVAVGYVGYFYDPVPGGATMRDTNAMYEVSGVAVAGAPWTLSMDVRNTVEDPTSYPWDRKAIYQGTVDSPAGRTTGVPQGSRHVCISAEATPRSGEGNNLPHVLTGRWFRIFEGDGPCDGDTTAGSCKTEPWAARIEHSILDADTTECDAGFNLIELTKGVPRTLAEGAPFLIDHGWQPGDTMQFFAPVEFIGASTVIGNAPVHMRIGVNGRVEGAIFTRVGRVHWYGDVSGGVGLKNVWVRDGAQSGTGNLAVYLADTTGDELNVERLWLTGMHDSEDRLHGFGISTGGVVTVTDSGCRYIGDDCMISAASSAGDVFRYSRITCEYQACEAHGTDSTLDGACGQANTAADGLGGGGGSMNCISAGGGGGELIYDDAICVNFSPHNTSSPCFDTGLGIKTQTSRRLVVIGSMFPTGSFVGAAQDLLDIGQWIDFAPTLGTPELLGTDADRWSLIRPEAHEKTSGSSLLYKQASRPTNILVVEPIIGTNYYFEASGSPNNDVSLLRNALIDTPRWDETSTTRAIWRNNSVYSTGTGSLTVENVTLAERPNDARTHCPDYEIPPCSDGSTYTGEYTYVRSNDDDTGVFFKDVVIDNFPDRAVLNAQHLDTVPANYPNFFANTSGSTFILNGHAQDVRTGERDHVTSNVYVNVDPGFLEPSVGDFRPRPDGLAGRTGAGIKSTTEGPGILDDGNVWALWKAGLAGEPGITLRRPGSGDGGGPLPRPAHP